MQFGSLQITARVCYSRPPTEAPQTDAFTEVDEVLENKPTHRIFTGWMFADSPGLHGVEHPVYDIWLTDCKGPGELIHEAPAVADAPADRRFRARPAACRRQTDAGRRAHARADAKEAQGDRRRARAARSQRARRAGGGPAAAARRPRPPPTRRNPPSQRFFPTEDQGLVPPANIGQ